jgi:hypothetical protein
MTSMLRNSILSAAILAAPLAAFAQSNPTGNLGSNNSATATKPTADARSSPLHAADANAAKRPPNAAAQNPHVPGATGQTVVPGTNSTVAGDRAATATSKTNPAMNGR